MSITSGLDEAPEISIVLATFDRPDALRKCLHGLLAQETPRRFEIIVVDNHPQSGQTGTLTKMFPQIVWRRETVAGLARARNCGISAARGQVIVTTDDDVLPPPGWLELLTAPLFRPDGPAATTGNCFPVKVETEAEVLFEAYGGLQHGSEPFCYDRAWMNQWTVCFPHLWRIGTTANAAFRREALDDPRVGPFEVKLGAGTPSGAYEDLYCWYRMMEAGYRICYVPEAELRHAHRESMDALRKQLFAYRRGETAFLALIWDRHRDWRAWGQVCLWIPQWRTRVFVQEVLRRLRGKKLFPFRLLWAENLSYFEGPAALRRTPS